MSLKISITGDLASGKSTLSHYLAEKLQLETIFVGNLLREMARDQDIDILKVNIEANKDLAKSAWMDRALDDAVKMKIDAFEAEGKDFIIDARVGFFYATDSLKIKLVTHPTLSAERAAKADRASESYGSIAEAFEALSLRRTLERERFISRYDVDIEDLANYDLVIDTSFITKEQTASIVEMVVSAQQEGKPFPKFWCHPAQLIPGGQATRGLSLQGIEHLIEEMKNGHYDQLEGVAQKAIQLRKNADGDYLLVEGHHRLIAACVTSLPVLGADVIPNTGDYTGGRVISNMYDNYDAASYYADKFARENPDKEKPFWGRYAQEKTDDILNSYKFGFVDRAIAAQNKPSDPAP